ncbi:MAG: polysaccharide deacetylase family protein [Oscillospiraceae bacterium]|jgi:peptidoglycan/xylan/chitin deacetylase (PgdA/CDA1 family)|nr:polysaccharide deacetylase family protein [Oscillospiraceae bacterium]
MRKFRPASALFVLLLFLLSGSCQRGTTLVQTEAAAVTTLVAAENMDEYDVVWYTTSSVQAASRPIFVDPNRPAVALTFDDGPSKYTARICSILREYGGKATFCVIGNRLQDYTSYAKAAYDLGFEIVGHSWDHKNLSTLADYQIEEELNRTQNEIRTVLGANPKFFRPPYGAFNQSVKNVSEASGLAILMWSVDSRDWASKDVDAIYSKIMNNVQDGSIILCHDIYESTADAMARVIPALVEAGYQLVTVSELLTIADKSVVAGKNYNHGRYTATTSADETYDGE